MVVCCTQRGLQVAQASLELPCQRRPKPTRSADELEADAPQLLREPRRHFPSPVGWCLPASLLFPYQPTYLLGYEVLRLNIAV